MTIFAAGKEQRLSGLDITSDSVVVYEGEPLDPLYRCRRVVPAAEIRRIREMPGKWFRRGTGLAVIYGRSRWFGRRQIFIPAATPQYAEIKAQFTALQIRSL